jgi:imidazolonepropionase-like amidohydrolase
MSRALVLVLLLIAAPQTLAQNPNLTVITGATLIDGNGGAPMRDAAIVVEGSRIRQVGQGTATKVPTGAATIDGRGKFVIPGLADMHHHLQSGSFRPQQNLQGNLRRLLAVGVTTIFNPSIGIADFTKLKAAAAQDASAFARFFGTGPIVTVKGDFFGAQVGAPTPETAAQAQTVVRDLKAAGVDAIKVQRDDFGWATTRTVPLMSLDVLTALANEAHQQGLEVYVHAPKLQLAKEALGAGVDGLLHGIIDEPVDDAFISMMKKNRAVYVSTQALYEDVGDVAAWAKRQATSWDRAALQPPGIYQSFTAPEGVKQFQSLLDNTAFTKERLGIPRKNLKRVFDAGIPVVLGTDTGFFGVLFGVATQIELELLVEAGLTPGDALRAATINAARMIGRDKDLGTIEAGKLADLVILDADPLADIRNVARVHRTMKGGVWYEPVDPAKPSN